MTFKMMFKSKEEYLAWNLHQTQIALREAVNMPSAMIPLAVQAVIADNQAALEESGYKECPAFIEDNG